MTTEKHECESRGIMEDITRERCNGGERYREGEVALPTNFLVHAYHEEENNTGSRMLKR